MEDAARSAEAISGEPRRRTNTPPNQTQTTILQWITGNHGTTTPENHPTSNDNTNELPALYTELPLQEPDPESIRIVFNNVNSLPTQNQGQLAATLRKYIDLQADVIGLAETNRNWTRVDDTVNPIKHTMNALLGLRTTRLETAHCKEDFNTNITQRGGVAQIILRKVSGRIKSQGKDPLGRWCWQELHLDGTRTLVLITAYRVCTPNTTDKETTTWSQQWRKLRAAGIDNPNPRRQFLQDLTEYLQSLRDDGKLYVVSMDANTSIYDEELNEMMTATDMVDLMDDHLPLNRPNTYAGGRHQIDMCLGSFELSDYISNAFILDPMNGPGDHSIIGIDLRFSALVNRDTMEDLDPTHQQQRLLVSTDVKASQRYLEYLKLQLDSHNISNRVKCLVRRCTEQNKCTVEDEVTFQQLNEQMWDFCKQAEKQCKKVGKYDWSHPLVMAGQGVQVAQKELSRIKRGGVPHRDDQD